MRHQKEDQIIAEKYVQLKEFKQDMHRWIMISNIDSMGPLKVEECSLVADHLADLRGFDEVVPGVYKTSNTGQNTEDDTDKIIFKKTLVNDPKTIALLKQHAEKFHGAPITTNYKSIVDLVSDVGINV